MALCGSFQDENINRIDKGIAEQQELANAELSAFPRHNPDTSDGDARCKESLK
ncbi:hypothetical protein NUACC21_35200 [Scytonema sp. NUACC21]